MPESEERLSQLRDEMNVALKPVLNRLYHYDVTRNNMDYAIRTYFFNATDAAKFTEVKSFIAGQYDDTPELGWNPCDTVSALDEWILNSGIGLVLDQHGYQFPYADDTEGLQQETVWFMQKLAHALSAFKVCLIFKTAYDLILCNPYLASDVYCGYQQAIEQLIQDFSEEYNPGDDVISNLTLNYEKAKTFLAAVQAQRNQLDSGQKEFTDEIGKITVIILETVPAIHSRLTLASSEFPDNTWTGDGWHTCIVGLLNQLLARNYSYSEWIWGALPAIDESFTGLFIDEIAHFSLTMQNQLQESKAILLDNTELMISNFITILQQEAAKYNYVLHEGKTLVETLGLYGLYNKKSNVLKVAAPIHPLAAPSNQ